jgi:hypothetical protein
MSDTTLGEILVALGIITDNQRWAVMDYQRLMDNPMTFGEILVQMKYCTPEQVSEAMGLQIRLRSDKTHDRAEATYDIARRSKEAIGEVRRQLIATGKAIIEKAGTADIPTPILGVPIVGS